MSWQMCVVQRCLILWSLEDMENSCVEALYRWAQLREEARLGEGAKRLKTTVIIAGQCLADGSCKSSIVDLVLHSRKTWRRAFLLGAAWILTCLRHQACILRWRHLACLDLPCLDLLDLTCLAWLTWLDLLNLRIWLDLLNFLTWLDSTYLTWAWLT